MQRNKMFVVTRGSRTKLSTGAWVRRRVRKGTDHLLDIQFVVPRHCYASVTAAFEIDGAHFLLYDHASRWFEHEFVGFNDLNFQPTIEAIGSKWAKKKVRVIQLASSASDVLRGIQRCRQALTEKFRQQAQSIGARFEIVNPVAQMRPRRELAWIGPLNKAYLLLARLQADTAVAEAAEREVERIVRGKVLS